MKFFLILIMPYNFCFFCISIGVTPKLQRVINFAGKFQMHPSARNEKKTWSCNILFICTYILTHIFGLTRRDSSSGRLNTKQYTHITNIQYQYIIYTTFVYTILYSIYLWFIYPQTKKKFLLLGTTR